jgi:8-oxo-dGTP pyrophosphatase MutT (NUDIX family)
MGGSILPVTIKNNTLFFLFGQERDIDENPGWSDFGGGTDKGETFLQTAYREGSEELTGFLGDATDIKKLLNKYGTYNIDFQSKGHTTYRCHIFPMRFGDGKPECIGDMDALPQYYNNNQRFLQKHLDPTIIRDTKIFEKTKIKWFSFDDMKKQHKNFRSFYQNIVSLILDQQPQIETFIKKSLNKKLTKTIKRYNNNTNKTRKNN